MDNEDIIETQSFAKDQSICANADRKSENSALPYFGTIIPHEIEIPSYVKDVNPDHIPIKKILFNHNTFEDKNCKMIMKIFPEENLLNIIISNNEAKYTVAIKKQNLLHDYIISDVLKKIIVIRGDNIQMIVEQQNMTKIVKFPQFEDEAEEKITIFPYSLIDALTQLKGTQFLEQRQRRGKKKIAVKEEEIPVVKKDKQKIQKKKENCENEEEAEKSPRILEKNRTSFKLPSEKVIKETQKLRQKIQKMDVHDKETVFLDIFKIRRASFEEKKMHRCPIYTCGRAFASGENLKLHLEFKHPKLAEAGISMVDGEIQYSEKAIDFVLYLGKLYPQEMKKIIKRMKTKKK